MPAVRKPPAIIEIGVDHWSDGKGNVKQFILGGPDVGKTRVASAYPRPLFLACESVETVAASIATRKIAYLEGLRPPRVVDVRSTQDMIDVIAKLEGQLRTAGPNGPSYQTAVVDTLDGFSRTIKDEWAAAHEDGVFTGRDAWSYLEAKMGLVLTRLLALDMNVVVLCHLKEKTTGEGEDKVTTYEPYLQGQTKDAIFHDFNLVGLMQTEWIPGDEAGERDRKRGITYEATPTFPFLKDHFHLQPPVDYRINNRRHWPVTLDDGTKGGKSTPEEFIAVNYGALVGAIFDGMDGLEDGGVVEQLEDSTGPSPDGAAPAAPGRGGPVAGAPAAPPAAAKKAAAAKPAKTTEPAKPAETPSPSPAAATATDAGSTQPAPSTPPAQPAPAAAASTASTEAPAPTEPAPSEPGVAADAGTPVASEPVAAETPAPAAAEETAAPAPEAAEPTVEQAVETVAQALDGEVVTEPAAADATGEPAAAQADNTCPVCGKDTSKESADLMQLSRLKHRDIAVVDGVVGPCVEGCTGGHLYDTDGSCFQCYQTLNTEKQSNTGHYAATA